MKIDSDLQIFLRSEISSNDQFWIACEFADGIMIYKARLNAILDLILIGQTWTQIFHVIQMKYDFMVSFRIEETGIKIKSSGDREFE